MPVAPTLNILGGLFAVAAGGKVIQRGQGGGEGYAGGRTEGCDCVVNRRKERQAVPAINVPSIRGCALLLPWDVSRAMGIAS